MHQENKSQLVNSKSCFFQTLINVLNVPEVAMDEIRHSTQHTVQMDIADRFWGASLAIKINKNKKGKVLLV